MLLPSDIKLQLYTYLPRHTSLFSKKLTIASADVVSASVVRVVTSVAHGLALTDVINVIAGRVENSLTAVAYDVTDTYAKFTTADNHDFTAPIQSDDVSTLELAGFTAPAWNTTHTISDIENRENITIPIPGTEPIPTLNGNEIVYEDRPAGIKGLWPVTNIIDPVTFEFTVSGVPGLPVNPVDGLEVDYDVAIGISADIPRAIEVYTKQNTKDDVVLFITFTDVDVSKDRNTLNDFTLTSTNQDESRLMIGQKFSTVAFFKITETISAAQAQEYAYGEVFEALLKSLYMFRKDNFKSQFGNIFLGSGPGINNTAYYTHVYDWQLPVLIDKSTGFVDPKDVAYRNMDIIAHMFTIDNPAILELGINLDEVEL